jgi:exodeoxyribonuclease-3
MAETSGRTDLYDQLLRSIADRQEGLHVLAGDFNTLAPGALLDVGRLAFRPRPFVWLSGGRIRWRTIQTVLDAGYVDAFRLLHPDDPGLIVPADDPQVRLDYAFVPGAYTDQIINCDVVDHPAVPIASDHRPVVLDLV